MNTRAVIEQSSPGDLLDSLYECHVEIRAHLGKLKAVVSGLQTGTPDEGLRRGAVEVVTIFSGPARDHNYDEERHVFPTLLACESGEVRLAAETLSEDHAWIEFCWLDIESQLSAVTAGSSCDVPALVAAASAFDNVTRDHMALEESILYPQLRDRLTPSTMKAMRREMVARRAAERRA